jgi:hypothetical protein
MLNPGIDIREPGAMIETLYTVNVAGVCETSNLLEEKALSFYYILFLNRPS